MAPSRGNHHPEAGLLIPWSVYLACLLLWASADGTDAIEKDNINGRGHRAVFETLDRQLGESSSSLWCHGPLEFSRGYHFNQDDGQMHVLFRDKLTDAAVDIARQLDGERARGDLKGPLHGVPIIVK